MTGPAVGRFVVLPAHATGQRIGLFGGSFNPPHAGHAALVHTALTRLNLDRLWVLVTPGNPLKDQRALAPFHQRAAQLHALIRDPRVSISNLEEQAGLRYSRDTVQYLVKRGRNLRFIWLMGADNLANFHLWQDWQRIAATLPIAVIDRPGASFAPLSSPAALAMAKTRWRETAAPLLAFSKPPAWTFLHARRMPQSSTILRARGEFVTKPHQAD